MLRLMPPSARLTVRARSWRKIGAGTEIGREERTTPAASNNSRPSRSGPVLPALFPSASCAIRSYPWSLLNGVRVSSTPKCGHRFHVSSRAEQTIGNSCANAHMLTLRMKTSAVERTKYGNHRHSSSRTVSSRRRRMVVPQQTRLTEPLDSRETADFTKKVSRSRGHVASDSAPSGASTALAPRSKV
jgi:hypothetical protein